MRVLAGCLLLASPSCAPVDRREPPSVIVISIDTLRADALGAYGESRPTSPAFDAFAREAMLFERAFSAAAQTAPAHASLFTSLYPSVHGVANAEVDARARRGEAFDRWLSFPRRLNDRVTTLAQALRSAGHRTAAFVGGGNLNREWGADQGFEVFDQDRENGLNGNLGAPFDVARPERWLADHSGQPVFLFLHTYIPHAPYLPPPPWDHAFDPDYRGGIDDDSETYPSALSGPRESIARSQRFWSSVDRCDPRDVEHLRALYAGDVRWADLALESLLAMLRRQGRYDDAVIVVTSDHGEEFGEHGGFEHSGELHREHVHVPLAIRAPGLASGRFAHAVRMIDVMPTVLELAGVAPPSPMQGRSLVGQLSGGPIADVAVSETVRAWRDDEDGRWPASFVRSVRAGGWTWIERSDGGARSEQLFELRNDPEERIDVVDSPAAHERLAYLRSLARRHERACARLALRWRAEPGARASDASVETLRALGYVE